MSIQRFVVWALQKGWETTSSTCPKFACTAILSKFWSPSKFTLTALFLSNNGGKIYPNNLQGSQAAAKICYFDGYTCTVDCLVCKALIAASEVRLCALLHKGRMLKSSTIDDSQLLPLESMLAFTLCLQIGLLVQQNIGTNLHASNHVTTPFPRAPWR